MSNRKFDSAKEQLAYDEGYTRGREEVEFQYSRLCPTCNSGNKKCSESHSCYDCSDRGIASQERTNIAYRDLKNTLIEVQELAEQISVTVVQAL